MSEARQPPSDPRYTLPPPNPAMLPTLATALYLAMVVALWGFTSLILDRDVIDYPDAGPLVGPAMAAAGCVVTFIATLLGVRNRSDLHPALRGLVTAIVAFAVILFVGAVGYSLQRDSFSVWFPAVLHFAIGPFMIGAAVLSGVVVGATAAFAGRERRS